MILAAGRGERMRPLTDHCPKPLLQVGGKPLIQWHIEAWRDAGIREMVINHAWLGEMIVEALNDGSELGCRIHYSPETTALETAGGIANARQFFNDEPFCVVNGDVFTDFPPAQLLAEADSVAAKRCLAHLVLVPNPPQHLAGDFSIDEQGLLVEEGEKFTFSGIGMYHPSFFDSIQSGQSAPLGPMLREAIRKGLVTGQKYHGLWQDIGTPERLSTLNQLLYSKG